MPLAALVLVALVSSLGNLQVEWGWGPHSALAARVVSGMLSECPQARRALVRVDSAVSPVARWGSWQDPWRVELRSVSVSAVVIPAGGLPLVAEASEVVPAVSWGTWEAGGVASVVVARLAARVGERLRAMLGCGAPPSPAPPESDNNGSDNNGEERR